MESQTTVSQILYLGQLEPGLCDPLFQGCWNLTYLSIQLGKDEMENLNSRIPETVDHTTLEIVEIPITNSQSSLGKDEIEEVLIISAKPSAI